MPIRIEPLVAHPEALDVLVQWFESEWPGHYGPGGPGQARQDLAGFAQLGRLPVGLIALRGDHLVGVAALKAQSIRSHAHLSPWAAAGLVRPSERRLGIGALLLAALEQQARDLGYPRLYCGTSTAESLLRRTGWELLERVKQEDQDLGIYCKVL